MDAATILQGLTISLLVLTLGGVVKLAIELGGFREWRRNVDTRLDHGERRMDRHSEGLRLSGHPSNGKIKPNGRS